MSSTRQCTSTLSARRFVPETSQTTTSSSRSYQCITTSHHCAACSGRNQMEETASSVHFAPVCGFSYLISPAGRTLRGLLCRSDCWRR
eukprot:1785471-Rhodomonas_salina.2